MKLKNKSMIPYKIRVEHKTLGFYSFYEIEADDWHDAEREAKQRFKNSFCNSDTPLTDLAAFTIDKYNTHYKNGLTAKGVDWRENIVVD